MSISGSFFLIQKNRGKDDGCELDNEDEFENEGDEDEGKKKPVIRMNVKTGEKTQVPSGSFHSDEVAEKKQGGETNQSGMKRKLDPQDESLQDEDEGERQGNIISIDINGNKKIPKLTGRLGDYYTDSDLYGPKWMDTVVYKRLEHYYKNMYVHLLGLVASHLGKSSATLRDNSDGAALVNEIGLASVITNQFNKNKGEEVSNTRISKSSKSNTSAFADDSGPSSEGSKDFSGKSAAEINKDLGNSAPSKLPARFNQRELYLWLLQDRKSLTASDLAVVEKMFSKNMNEDIKWLDFPSIGGKLNMSETMVGSMDYCLWEVRRRMGLGKDELKEAKVVHDHPEAFSLLIAKKIELSSRTRFLTDTGRRELKMEYGMALDQLVEELSGGPASRFSASAQVWTRVHLNKNRFSNPLLAGSGFDVSGRGGGGSVSEFDKWMFRF